MPPFHDLEHAYTSAVYSCISDLSPMVYTNA